MGQKNKYQFCCRTAYYGEGNAAERGQARKIGPLREFFQWKRASGAPGEYRHG